MDGQTKDRLSVAARVVIVLVVLLIASPVLYILSGGPALWLVNHGYLDGWTYFRIYRPVSAFAYNHPTFNDAMNWYLSWWGEPVDLFADP